MRAPAVQLDRVRTIAGARQAEPFELKPEVPPVVRVDDEVLAGDLALQCGGRALGDDPAAIDDADAVRLLRFLEVVSS